MINRQSRVEAVERGSMASTPGTITARPFPEGEEQEPHRAVIPPAARHLRHSIRRSTEMLPVPLLASIRVH